MNINFHDGLNLSLTFICGVYCLLRGLKAKKVEDKRQAGILLILMAICAFVLFILEMLNHVLDVTHSRPHIISTVQLVVAGVWLGIFIVMLVFGHFEILKKPSETSGKK